MLVKQLRESTKTITGSEKGWFAFINYRTKYKTNNNKPYELQSKLSLANDYVNF